MLPSTIYEAVFKNAPIGCYLLSTTPEVTILDVNDAFLRSVFLTREDIIGKGLFEVFPADPDDSKDTGVEALRQSIAMAVATGQSQVMPVQRYPIQRTLPSGEVIFEERFWNASNTPIYDADGRMACIFHATMDITKQVHVETALRQSESQSRQLAQQAQQERFRLQTIVDTIPTGLIMMDERGELVIENDEWKRTWAKSSLPPSSILDYDSYKGFRPDTGKRISSEEWPCAMSFKQGIQTRDVILDIERFDGTPGTIVVSSSPIRDNTGHVVGAVAANMDITELRVAQSKLQEADRRKDEFLAMLAHELRNPLAPIGAAAELLQVIALDEEQVRQASQIITRQVDHMTNLINDLLDVSRVTRGLIEIDAVPTDIRHVVNEAVEQVTPLIRARRHHLTIQSPPDTTMVTGDKKRLVQVLVNILTNAAKYTPEEGNIMLEIEVREEYAALIVCDDGIGMTADLAAHVFELFSQGQRSADRTLGGLGIGLALVKSLVELHGGTVSCSSKGLGHGSQFTVTLPRLSEQNITPGHIERQSQKKKSDRPLRILLVDDNADAATMLAMYLGALGHEVMVEYSAHKALERAKNDMPDVFLLDIGLPEMDGNELARQIRLQSENDHSTLIAITGYGQERDRKNSLSAGFDHHLVKPVDTKRLTEILNGIHQE